jgi:MICOS complex subunit MIC26
MNITDRVKSFKAPHESLTPGILYVGIAGLTGSILARNRFILTRLLLPPTFFVLAAHHFLPQTTHNITSYLGQVEERYFPTMAEKHEIAKAHSAMTWERLKEGTKSGREQADRIVGEGVGKVQELTGLKLKETLGWGEGVLSKAKETAADLTAKAEKKAEEIKVVVENKAEEVKKEVEKKPEPPKRLV